MKRKSLALLILGTVVCVIVIVITICLASAENESKISVRLRPQYEDLVDEMGIEEAIKQKGDIFLHPTDEEIKEYLHQHPAQANVVIAESFCYDLNGDIIYKPELQSMIMDIQGPYPDLGNSPYGSAQYRN